MVAGNTIYHQLSKDMVTMSLETKKREKNVPVFLFSFQGFQPFPLKQQHIKHSDCDGRVSEVEDRAEEDEMPVRAEEEIR